MVTVPEAQSDCVERGKAKLCILDFKTTWSEFHMASQTATKRCKAELRVLNSKTTWSELGGPNSLNF